MMTGDSYRLPIKIETTEGVATPAMFEEVEVFVGNIRKTLSSGQISFDDERQMFLIPLSQEETFRLREKNKVQLRCKFEDNSVVGIDAGEIELTKATSKVVL